jgi:hypothetical protein
LNALQVVLLALLIRILVAGFWSVLLVVWLRLLMEMILPHLNLAVSAEDQVLAERLLMVSEKDGTATRQTLPTSRQQPCQEEDKVFVHQMLLVALTLLAHHRLVLLVLVNQDNNLTCLLFCLHQMTL